jgi:ubiquinol-cytochrome c reductase iron-sulfur subunit
VSEPLSRDRRRLRILAGLAAIGVGAPIAWKLAERPQPPSGTPTPVDFGKLRYGRLLTIEWERRTVWVLRRTPEQIEALAQREDQLLDATSAHSLQPEACRNRHRSLRPEVFVAIGLCTHQGCPPALQRGDEPFAEFLCPCHTSKFDLAGRVFANGPAPANLVIPEYHFGAGDVVVIGRLA